MAFVVRKKKSSFGKVTKREAPKISLTIKTKRRWNKDERTIVNGLIEEAKHIGLWQGEGLPRVTVHRTQDNYSILVAEPMVAPNPKPARKGTILGSNFHWDFVPEDDEELFGILDNETDALSAFEKYLDSKGKTAKK